MLSSPKLPECDVQFLRRACPTLPWRHGMGIALQKGSSGFLPTIGFLLRLPVPVPVQVEPEDQTSSILCGYLH